MFKHAEVHHKHQEPPQFSFQVVKYCNSALERQVREAVRIAVRVRSGVNVMNSKSKFNRSKLPRIIIQEPVNENENFLDHGQENYQPGGQFEVGTCPVSRLD